VLRTNEGDMTNQAASVLRLIQLGVEHPHAAMYRQTMAVNPDIEFVGAVDRDVDRARTVLAGEGIDVPIYADLPSLLARHEADAALVTLTNEQTPAAVIEAAGRGLHVFIEKPGARTADEFAPVMEAIERNRVVFSMGYLRRFSPVATHLRNLVRDGLIGDLVSAQITFATLNVAQRNAAYQRGSRPELLLSGEDKGSVDTTAPVHWMFDHAQAGGGIMHWLGVHWLDLLRFVSDDDITSVSGRLDRWTEVPIDVEDTASLTLGFSRGMLATLSSGYVLDKGPDQIAISFQGSKGWMMWPGSGDTIELYSNDPSWADEPRRSLTFTAEPIGGYSGRLGYETLDAFRRAILSGETLPITPNDAYQVLRVLDAARASSDQGQVIGLA
jgi:predicted dehydrogenase